VATVACMSEIAEKFEKVAAGFDARVQGAPDDGWSKPAPCEGWTVVDIVDHVTGNYAGLCAGAGFTPTQGLEPKQRWAEARQALSGALADPEKAALPVEGPFGPSTIEGMVAQLLINDTLIHTWDLARATGQDETLDAEAVASCQSALTPLDAMIRRPGVFGPKVESAADADDQTKMLNFVGRTV
jgi:uncharacterized protein (TIGR03086 family)